MEFIIAFFAFVSAVTSDYYANNRQTASKKRKRKKGQKTKVKKKVIRTVKSQFTYDRKKCNLVSANNTDGQKVTIDYDQRGRISEIVDQANKTVTIRYEERFGKPQFVTRPGLGTIKVSYKKNGQVDTVVSKDGPVVARQVASIFNNLLDIIAPATSEVNL